MFNIDENLVEMVLMIIFDTVFYFSMVGFILWYFFGEEPEPPKRRYEIRRIH